MPSRSAAQKVNKTLDEHLQSRGLLMQSPDHDEMFEPHPEFWFTYSDMAGPTALPLPPWQPYK